MDHRAACLAGLIVATTLLAACGSDSGPGAVAPPTTQITGNTDSYSYELSCPSPVGDLTTSLTFTVTDSSEQVKTGQTVTYKIVAPIAQVKAPVTPTFISSTNTFAVPAGFKPTTAATEPPTNENFTSSSAQIQGNNIVVTLNGSFPLDGSPRPTPTLVVTGTATGPAGSMITWMTPTSINGKANAGIFGDQDSNCTFPTTGPIGTTNIAS